MWNNETVGRTDARRGRIISPMDKDIAGSLLHKAFRVDEPALAALP